MLPRHPSHPPITEPTTRPSASVATRKIALGSATVLRTSSRVSVIDGVAPAAFHSRRTSAQSSGVQSRNRIESFMSYYIREHEGIRRKATPAAPNSHHPLDRRAGPRLDGRERLA